MCIIGPSAVKVRFSLTSNPPEGIGDLLGRISATFPSISDEVVAIFAYL